MQTPSAFRPISLQGRTCFTVIMDPSAIGDQQMSFTTKTPILKPLQSFYENQKPTKTVKKIDRNWTLNSTKYVMLKYRQWQLALRRAISFVDFLKDSSDDLQKYFYMKKSPSQIKDKINNTKAGYISLIENIKNEQTGLPSNIPTGSSSKKIPTDVFYFMDRFYNAQRSVFIEDVVAEIDSTLSDESKKGRVVFH
ncbi:hypothetical protein ENUP19_0274G0087 [Entamoeba nuttalli]|uniref:Uncharacterized protein n=2 Tax=Entamoeba nuttalli TaxID=412467 RepID=K2GYE3_ENTNP|nr:hypothetical protein ENU1_096380 [Entamoeba nuttalli P19]EKE40263.1 hypothetical protein ENU1_096380 [Entamoeba nuttalli P19]|eukprot:XP_008857403.1 hypothetical protein ENU1_096380 [Entamoeba nuttalli P19]